MSVDDPAAASVREAPPPWELRGRGWVVLSRPGGGTRREPGAEPEEGEPGAPAGFSLLVFADYSSSDVGPYRELLCATRRFLPADRRWHWSIGACLVSSEPCVVNGRTNWGIPKGLADFETARDGEDERVGVLAAGQRVASLAFRATWPKLPVSTLMLPRPWYRFGQEMDGRSFVFAPRARARVRRARLLGADLAEPAFRDALGEGPLACFEVTELKMRFPIPRVFGGG